MHLKNGISTLLKQCRSSGTNLGDGERKKKITVFPAKPSKRAL